MPSAIPSNESGELLIGARNGVGSARDFLPPALETNRVYNLWIDIKNDPIDTGDLYTIYLQREGETNRTELFKDYIGDRDPAGAPPATGGGPTLPDLDKLFVGNNGANAVFFDDFYISKTGYNTSVPRAFEFTTPAGGQPQPPTVSITRTGDQIKLAWTDGTLESATAITGPWAAVAGAVAPSYSTAPGGTQQYFRIRR